MDVTEDELLRIERFDQATGALRRTLLGRGANQGVIKLDRMGMLQQTFTYRVRRTRNTYANAQLRVNETGGGYYITRFESGRMVYAGPMPAASTNPHGNFNYGLIIAESIGNMVD